MSRITTEQVSELLAQNKAGRITREKFQKFLMDSDDASCNGPGYTVSVDFNKFIHDMVRAGRYNQDYGHLSRLAALFNVKGEGVITVALELIHLNRVASSDVALAHLERNGLRPATIEELLAFGASYPEIQKRFHVVCLGSSCSGSHNDGCFVPVLRGHPGFRELHLTQFNQNWDSDCRFLAVRK